MRKFIALSLSMAALASTSCSQAQDAPVIAEAIPTIAQPASDVISEALNGAWKKIDTESHLKFTAKQQGNEFTGEFNDCLLYTSPSPRDATLSRMPSSA